MTEAIECNSIKTNFIETSNLNNQQFALNESVKLKSFLLQGLKKENQLVKGLVNILLFLIIFINL